MQCKVCGKKAESEYCFAHKPKKALKSHPKIRDPVEKYTMWGIFLSIWEERPHRSEISGTPITGEPLTIYFHHILPKGNKKYARAKEDKENIILLTWEEHDIVESDPYRYEVINKRREYLLLKYEI